MKTQKILILSGTGILMLASFFAVMANKKRAGVTLYLQCGPSNCIPIATVTTIFTTAGSGSTIIFRNSLGVAMQAYTQSNFSGTTCQNPVSVRI